LNVVLSREFPRFGQGAGRGVQRVDGALGGGQLYQWACADPGRRFDDLFNLVSDPAFLRVAWDRVRSNRGARTAGVDRRTASSIALHVGVEEYLDRLRSALKDRSFRPLPLRERMIPKPGGKKRRLGIATITDRVVQASLKLVLEPIFETDFFPCSYGSACTMSGGTPSSTRQVA
jgi:RNA-directed DNA polymerase